MWSPRQFALLALAFAHDDGSEHNHSAHTECGSFTAFAAPAEEVCVSETCDKIKFQCPVGFTVSYENSIKCKGGLWKGPDETVHCTEDNKPCPKADLASVGDGAQMDCRKGRCSYSCADGSEPSVSGATCNFRFGKWEYDGSDDKPGRIRCEKQKTNCGDFTNFDSDSVDVVSCDNKKCSFACKSGFHSISADGAKCRSGSGAWKVNNGASRVACYGQSDTWMNEWKTSDFDWKPPFKCDPDDLRRVTLTKCNYIGDDDSITECDVMCKGTKIDTIRCINHRPMWSNEYFDC